MLYLELALLLILFLGFSRILVGQSLLEEVLNGSGNAHNEPWIKVTYLGTSSLGSTPVILHVARVSSVSFP